MRRQEIDLEGTMLSEIHQTEKDKYCMIITYIWTLKTKLVETESRIVVGRDWGLGS